MNNKNKAESIEPKGFAGSQLSLSPVKTFGFLFMVFKQWFAKTEIATGETRGVHLTNATLSASAETTPHWGRLAVTTTSLQRELTGIKTSLLADLVGCCK